MTKKIIIIGIIILAGLIALVLFKGGSEIPTSISTSSPENVVKDFFQAIRKGNLEKAKEYISLTAYNPSVESLLGASKVCSVGYWNEAEKRENEFLKKHCVISLGQAIKDIEIKNKQIEKAFGLEEAVLLVKINFEPGSQENAQTILEEYQKTPIFKRGDVKGILPVKFLAKFPEEIKVILEKYEQGWKIESIEL